MMPFMTRTFDGKMRKAKDMKTRHENGLFRRLETL